MRASAPTSRHATRAVAKFTTAFAILFASYTVVGASGKYLSSKGEFFPVFSWSLFTEVRNPRWITALEIVQVGEEAYDPPVGFYHLPEHFPDARRKTIRPMKLANRIRRSVERDYDDAEELIAHMEKHYLNIGVPVRWQVSSYHVDLIEYHRTGEIAARRQIMPVRLVGSEQ
ncbi:MAG: hypothetical protein AAFY66_02890 [Pseudomonadota bacterium]